MKRSRLLSVLIILTVINFVGLYAWKEFLHASNIGTEEVRVTSKELGNGTIVTGARYALVLRGHYNLNDNHITPRTITRCTQRFYSRDNASIELIVVTLRGDEEMDDFKTFGVMLNSTQKPELLQDGQTPVYLQGINAEGQPVILKHGRQYQLWMSVKGMPVVAARQWMIEHIRFLSVN